MVVDIVVGAFKKHFEGKLTFHLSLGREVVMQVKIGEVSWREDVEAWLHGLRNQRAWEIWNWQIVKGASNNLEKAETWSQSRKVYLSEVLEYLVFQVQGFKLYYLLALLNLIED